MKVYGLAGNRNSVCKGPVIKYDLNSLGQKMRSFRFARNMSQSELADTLKLHRNVVSRAEQNQTVPLLVKNKILEYIEKEKRGG